MNMHCRSEVDASCPAGLVRGNQYCVNADKEIEDGQHKGHRAGWNSMIAVGEVVEEDS